MAATAEPESVITKVPKEQLIKLLLTQEQVYRYSFKINRIYDICKEFDNNYELHTMENGYKSIYDNFHGWLMDIRHYEYDVITLEEYTTKIEERKKEIKELLDEIKYYREEFFKAHENIPSKIVSMIYGQDLFHDEFDITSIVHALT